jgi:hypothetical protein
VVVNTRLNAVVDVAWQVVTGTCVWHLDMPVLVRETSCMMGFRDCQFLLKYKVV